MTSTPEKSTSLSDSPNGVKSPEIPSSAETVVAEEQSNSSQAVDSGAKRPKKRQTKNKRSKGNKQKEDIKSNDGSHTKDVTAEDAAAEIAPSPTFEDKFTLDLQKLLEPLEKTPEEADPSDPVTEFLSKRIRNLQKRKLRIEKIAEISDTEKLNADQLAALKNREFVESVLKELTETLELHKLQQEQLKAKAEAAQAELKEQVKKMLVEAKELGITQGEDKIFTLIKFLRAASIQRHLAAQDFSVTPQSAGFEALLHLVYNGDDTSLASVTKLYDGSLDLVAEDTVSYKTLRDVSRLPEEVLRGEVETVEEEAKQEEGEEGAASTQELTGSDSVQVSGEASSQSSVKISFLQESELDEDAAAATAAAAAPTATPTSAPTSTPTTDPTAATNPPTATADTPVPADLDSAPPSTTPTAPEKPQRNKKRHYYNRNRNNNANSGSHKPKN